MSAKDSDLRSCKPQERLCAQVSRSEEDETLKEVGELGRVQKAELSI